MHEFTFLFRLEPAGDFGLPEHDTIVAKKGGQAHTAAIDGLTFNIVAHGTPSHYREDSEAIVIERAILGLEIRLQDNYLWVVSREEAYKEAEATVLEAVERFVELLALNRGTYFSAEFLQATVAGSGERSVARKPGRVKLGRIKAYSLSEFNESLQWSLETIPFSRDEKVAKALDYFNHAQFLSLVREGLPFGHLKAHSYLAADIFSNYYRAGSVIIGDPSKDRDFQSRYLTIGLSEEAWKKMERVRKLRNDYGVAHYDLGDKSEELERELKMAVGVTQEVITCYLSKIRSEEMSR
jgi:hypothetical protein